MLGLRHAFGCLLSTALLALPAHAEKADRYKDTVINAGAMVADDLKQVTTYTGNVELTKGSILLKGERLEIRRDPEGYDHGTVFAAPGQLAYFRQKREGVDEYVEGVAERIEYNGKTEVVKLFNRAVLKRLVCGKSADEVRGETVTYDQRTEIYTAQGGPQSPTGDKRIRAVIQPKERDPQQPAAAAAQGCKPEGPAVPLQPSTRLTPPAG